MINKAFVAMVGGLIVAETVAFALPRDVSRNSWAAGAVQETIANKVLVPLPDGRFHGNMPVSRAQLVLALAAEGRTLTAHKWLHHSSSPVPDSVASQLRSGDWRSKPVTRYMLASVLARLGDYINNGIHPASPSAKDTNKSSVIPGVRKLPIPAHSPYYSALRYLASNKMVWPGSVLLYANNTHVTAAQLSTALVEFTEGVNNRLTSLGLDKNGSTPDRTFHRKK